MPAGILEQIAEGPVLGDGGYVYILEQRGVPMNDYTPYGILSHQDEVGRLYHEFYGAGVDIIQAQTFQGTRNRLDNVGMGDRYEDIHKQAVDLARASTGPDVLIAGSIGSAVGSAGLSERGLTTDEARGLYAEEANLLAELGVDFLIVETFFHMDDMTAGIEGAREPGLSVVATATFRKHETTLENGVTTAEEAALGMVSAGADVVGINCMREPAMLLPLAREMGASVSTPLALQPVAIQCQPEYVHISQIPKWTERVLSPSAMADYASEAVEDGVRYVGSCCGSGPEHVRAMAEALGKPARG